MDSLLKWSIANSDPNAPRPSPSDVKKLDPGIIDAILGKSDAEKMKEAMEIAVDESKSEDERVEALDNLEMLIEQIDNANNLEKLKMWDPLQSLLTSETSTDSIRLQVLWVIGTALQNNPSAQDFYLTLDPIPALTKYVALSSSPSSKIRAKALYALSGLLRHNGPAVEKLESSAGWERLKEALQDPDISVRRKTAFLLNSLLHPATTSSTVSGSQSSNNMHTPTPHHPNSHTANLVNPERTDTSSPLLQAVQNHGIVDVIVQGLADPVPFGEDGDQEHDEDFEEKAVGFLHTYLVECNGKLKDAPREQLKLWFRGQNGGDGKWGLGQGERKALEDSLV